jgi:hypothetical protein
LVVRTSHRKFDQVSQDSLEVLSRAASIIQSRLRSDSQPAYNLRILRTTVQFSISISSSLPIHINHVKPRASQTSVGRIANLFFPAAPIPAMSYP